MEKFSWNTSQYNKFSLSRIRPALDLLRVAGFYIEDPKTIWDLGCGTGNVTAYIAKKWPKSTITGIDNSVEMLTACRENYGKLTNIKWKEGDLQFWDPADKVDLIFSNAVFQWLPDQKILLNKFLKKINDGGCLAVQIPNNWDSPSHAFVKDVLADKDLLTPEINKIIERKKILSREYYYDLLSPEGKHVDIWTTEYLHVLEGDNPVFEWIKGTYLIPIVQSLQNSDRNFFLDACQNKLRTLYPKTTDGNTLFPFSRMFFVVLI